MPQGVLVQVQSSAPFLFMKYLLLIAVALFLLVTPWCIHKVGRTDRLSISQHVAKSRLTVWVFGIVGFVATIFAATTLYSASLPSHNASIITYAIFSVIILEMLISVIIPHIEGSWRGIVHNTTAWGLCFSIPFATIALLFLKLEPFAFWYIVATLGIEIILLIMALGWPKLRKWFLQFQSSYLVIFFALLVVLTFG